MDFLSRLFLFSPMKENKKFTKFTENISELATLPPQTLTKTRFTLGEIFPDSLMFPDSSVLEYSDSLAFTLKGYSDS